MFLTLMVIGLVGLVMMAIPAFGNHAPGSHGHLPPGAAHGGALGHAPVNAHPQLGPHASATASSTSSSTSIVPKEIVPADTHGAAGLVRFIPSPRAVASVLALYGAFGNALVHAVHLSLVMSAVVAIVPAFLFERFAVRPLWNLIFRFQAHPSAPLEALVLDEASAVTPFKNGKGMISVVREGRRCQFSARLRPEDAMARVAVGDRLRIEDVDSKNERFVVSVFEDPERRRSS